MIQFLSLGLRRRFLRSRCYERDELGTLLLKARVKSLVEKQCQN
jgi:hypothetical protein